MDITIYIKKPQKKNPLKNDSYGTALNEVNLS